MLLYGALYHMVGLSFDVTFLSFTLFNMTSALQIVRAQLLKIAIYCPQGSGTLRQHLLMMHGISWYCIVLHSIAWYCMVLHGSARYCMALHGIAW